MNANSRDNSRRNEAERLLQARVRQQAAVAEIGQFALSETNLQAIFDRVVAIVAETLEIPFCKILELAPAKDRLLLRAGVGWREGLAGTATVGAGLDSQAGFTLQSREPVIVADLGAETRFNGPQLLHDHHVVSGVSTVIQGVHGPFGVLGAHTNVRRDFSQDDINFLIAIANTLTTAVEREYHQRTVRYLATIVQSSTDAIVGMKLDGVIESWNKGAEKLYGYTAVEIIGRHISLLSMPDQQQETMSFLRRLARGEKIDHFETRRIRKDGEALDISLSISPIFSPGGNIVGAAAISRDITPLKKAEREREELLARERSTRRQAELATERFTFLAKAGVLLGSSLDYEETLTAVIRLATPRLADWCAVSLLNDAGRLEVVAVAHVDPQKEEMARQIYQKYLQQLDSRAGSYRILKSGDSVLQTELTDEMLQMAAANEKELKILRAFGLRSLIVAPMITRGQRIGALTLVNAKKSLQYSADDLVMAQELAARAATAVDNARLYHQTKHLNQELEKRVQQRTMQLEAANSELEAFAYSVSHDLRAPLRAMDGFSRILLEDYVAAMPEDAAFYLRRIRSNAQQMGNLIDDLLSFSRLSRQPLKKETVYPNRIVEMVVAQLQEELGERQVEFVIDRLPPCQADARLLSQVYINLLENAVKYTRNREHVRIHVGAEEKNGTAVYFVQDNGIGFDPQYTDKIFGVFQRLHRAEDFDGTGAGLAIVQRILYRHNGRIWATAEVGKGATFYFTLAQMEEI